MEFLLNRDQLFFKSKDLFSNSIIEATNFNALFMGIAVEYDNEHLFFEPDKKNNNLTAVNNGISYNKWIDFSNTYQQFGIIVTTMARKMLDGTAFTTTKISFKNPNDILDEIKKYFNAKILIKFDLDFNKLSIIENIEQFIFDEFNTLKRTVKPCYLKNDPNKSLPIEIYAGFNLSMSDNTAEVLTDKNTDTNKFELDIFSSSAIIYATICDDKFKEYFYKFVQYFPHLSDKELVLENMEQNNKSSYYLTTKYPFDIDYDYIEIINKLSDILSFFKSAILVPFIGMDIEY